MREPNDANNDRRVRVTVLRYGGLDSRYREASSARTIWFLRLG